MAPVSPNGPNTNDKLLKWSLRYAILFSAAGSRCSANQPNKLSNNHGQITSSITDNKGCGTSRSPWIISANPGQTIQLDLVDFAANSQTSNLVSCRSVYGFILERALGINHTICGGRHREGALYTSKTNSVEVYILSRDKRGGENFLIKYFGEHGSIDLLLETICLKFHFMVHSINLLSEGYYSYVTKLYTMTSHYAWWQNAS